MHDHGLAQDLKTFDALQQRRRALGWLVGAGVLPLLACGGGGDDDSSAASTLPAGSSCAVIPSETAGPFPGDGSNSVAGSTVNALALSGIVRSDIRSSLPASLGAADGVPLRIVLNLVNTSASCASLAGHAIYLWHCDRSGLYSMYSAGVTSQNYLRGVQVTDSNGQVRFDSIFPACYAGRWPHVHFEIFPSLAAASSGANDVKTSQLALPEASCREVFASNGYGASIANLNAITLGSDNVFSDGTTLQMASVTGTIASGYVATLTVGIAA